MNRLLLWGTVVSLGLLVAASAAAGATFTPIEPVPSVTIVGSSPAYPGGRYEADNLLDGLTGGSPGTEYSSAGNGTETYVDFDFGKPTPLAAFKHVDRFDPATVAASRLVFSTTADFRDPVAELPVKHANVRGGTTLFPFPSPVTTRYVRWKVTGLGPQGYGTVGGAEIVFFTAGEPDPAPVRDALEVHARPAIVEREGRPLQPLEVVVRHPYAEPAHGALAVGDAAPTPIELRPGAASVEILVPAVETTKAVELALSVEGRTIVRRDVALEPVRRWEVVFLPHSHVDIGYTHVQTEVERMQWSYLEQAIDIARRTAQYPVEARFRWNTEGLWAVDSYLEQATPEKRKALVEAVRNGWIHLDGLYGNELTGLCRPEELFRLLDRSRRLSKQYDLTIDAAMISDVPGYTWGIVPALAHSGIKYFSIGPNHVHRIGYTLDRWGDRPFYWVSPSGQERVLCWMAGKAYSWFHGGRLGRIKDVQPRELFAYLENLAAADYPYEMVQVRYSIGGDNGPPDPDLCEFVRDWNDRYIYPRLRIATTSELFHEFEQRYGDRIPEVRGDFTPYWEDGAASSARETALARNASERLVQAEALFAMLDPAGYPADRFDAAWRNVILYNEHTWGAHCSISQPDSQFTRDQWAIKQAFALDADEQSKGLVGAALGKRKTEAGLVTCVDVFNTGSWPRTDVVIVPGTVPLAGAGVRDAQGQPVASQRAAPDPSLAAGLFFLAEEVPAFGAKRFYFDDGEPLSAGSAGVREGVLSTDRLRVTLDDSTGTVAGLTWSGAPGNLVDATSGTGLDGYLYVPGRNPEEQVRAGRAEIVTGQRGPLVASVTVVTRDAPGCEKLERVFRVYHGIDRIDVHNILDKTPVRSKESVHFAFPFHVPDGEMRMDIPWAVIRPELDQLPGACKNYLTVSRWADVSNDRYGVTWTTLDAPLVELGGITVDVASPFQSAAWIDHLKPGGALLSYVMNNYWETNYKADQQGVTEFRYSIRPHAEPDSAAATRFAVERSQPLVVVPVDAAAPRVPSRMAVEPPSVIVTSLKPAAEGDGLVMRLFNAGDRPEEARVVWPDDRARPLFHSSPFEEKGPAVTGPVSLPPYGIATLLAE